MRVNVKKLTIQFENMNECRELLQKAYSQLEQLGETFKQIENFQLQVKMGDEVDE
jgi:hypothetical protein